MPQVNEDTLRSMTNWAKYSSGAAGVANMLRLARSEPGIPISPDDLDKDPFAFNVANGTLNLRTGELRPARQEDYCTKLSPVQYREDAGCPLWRAFLTKVLGADAELETFIRRFAGYCTTGDIREQVVVIFHGAGSNGKTTLQNVLLDVLGDYGLKANEGLLREKRGESHPTEIAGLCGRRLAISSETSARMKLSESRVKELTGGEKISARRMREDFWEFDPTHKLLVATNHRPEIEGTDHAIWRRIRLVPFNVIIPDAEQDASLPEKLKGEYPGILRWMVEGCLEWQKQGLNNPSAVVTATAGYRASEDLLGGFIDSCCRESADAFAGSTALLEAYRRFSGDREMGSKRFGGLLGNRGYTSGRFTQGGDKGKACWRGLEIIVSAG